MALTFPDISAQIFIINAFWAESSTKFWRYNARTNVNRARIAFVVVAGGASILSNDEQFPGQSKVIYLNLMLSLFLVYFVKRSRWFCFDLNAFGEAVRGYVYVFVHTSVVMNSKWMWYCVQYQVEKVFFCSASGFIKKSTYHRIYMCVA